MNDLRVTTIQSMIHWENPEQNRLHFGQHLGAIEPGSTDLVVLPEMFTTGFSMNVPQAAEAYSEGMPTLQWMKSHASRLNAVITGSVSISDGEKCYNRLFWVKPNGSVSHYDKRHLFQMAGENNHYQQGKERLIEELNGWKILPLICYDLRFPVWSRNRLINGVPEYDVLIYVANWPAVRREPWKKLALARAIENQVYTVAVNRVGTDDKDLDYNGDSAVINPRGEYLHFVEGTEDVCTSTLSYAELKDFREKFPVLSDADGFRIDLSTITSHK